MFEPHEIIELWAERAAIIEYDSITQASLETVPRFLHRQNAERRAYVQVKRQYGIKDMPAATFTWKTGNAKQRDLFRTF